MILGKHGSDHPSGDSEITLRSHPNFSHALSDYMASDQLLHLTACIHSSHSPWSCSFQGFCTCYSFFLECSSSQNSCYFIQGSVNITSLDSLEMTLLPCHALFFLVHVILWDYIYTHTLYIYMHVYICIYYIHFYICLYIYNINTLYTCLYVFNIHFITIYTCNKSICVFV